MCINKMVEISFIIIRQSKTESSKLTRKNKTVETALPKPTRKPTENNT